MSANQQVLAGLGGSPSGQQLFTTSGSFIVPTGVNFISVVARGANGLNGGSLSYVNAISVTPGESLTVTVGNSSSTVSLARSGTVLVRAIGGNSASTNIRQGGGNGGAKGADGIGDSFDAGKGGYGGAGGYSGNGGNGGTGGAAGYNAGLSGSAGSGGGGGGGGGGSGSSNGGGGAGGSGGSVGLLGLGINGAGGLGGVAPIDFGEPGNDGNSGGNGSGGSLSETIGGLRIIWPGNLRQFPSTRTANE